MNVLICWIRRTMALTAAALIFASVSLFLCQASRADSGTVVVIEPALAESTSLRFEGATLAEAAAEFNKYNDTQLVIADPAISDIAIGGGFRATRPELFVAALRELLGVRAVRSDGLIRLYGPAPARPAARHPCSARCRSVPGPSP